MSPTTELRIILEAIRDDLFVDELLVEFNKAFFAGIRYVFQNRHMSIGYLKLALLKRNIMLDNLEKILLLTTIIHSSVTKHT